MSSTLFMDYVGIINLFTVYTAHMSVGNGHFKIAKKLPQTLITATGYMKMHKSVTDDVSATVAVCLTSMLTLSAHCGHAHDDDSVTAINQLTATVTTSSEPLRTSSHVK